MGSRPRQRCGTVAGGRACALVALLAILSCAAHAATDVKFDWSKDMWYNPSLVQAGDTFVSAVKSTRMQRMGKKNWWINSLRMCEGSVSSSSSSGMQALTCKPYDPWAGKYKECEFDDRVRGGKLDTAGLGDVKVWRWPGRGVYAIFGRKPQRNGTSVLCNGFVVYHQWIAQIKAEEGAGEWRLEQPLPLLVPASHAYPEGTAFAMEKNWMPFVHMDANGAEHLYVSYLMQPHIVLEVMPSGETVHRWTSHDEQLMAKFAPHHVHGGPPVVYVPADRSPSGAAYYLGVMHHIEKVGEKNARLYRHFAFKTAPHPPFEVTAVSDELPLVFNATYKARTALIAFVSGLDLSPSGDVLITYGSADVNARLLSLPLPELEGLFSGGVAFRDVDVPHEPVAEHAKARRLLGRHGGSWGARRRQQQAAAGGRRGRGHLRRGGDGLEDGEEDGGVHF
ncbi:hypothetical protein FOA52_001722 [Chlamydomonas sp. UWO 241]|nr:hypothetical protein FOA52_001722 [Chlamydomonas sp. UWO 241]